MAGANAVHSFVGRLLRDSRVAEFAWDGSGKPWRVRRNGHWATIDDIAPPDAEAIQDMVLSWWGMRFGRQDSFPDHIVTATMVTNRGGWRYTFAPQSVSAWGSSLYVRRINPVISLQEGRTMPMQVSAFIKALLRARTSIIVAGRPASGKTTLLGGLVLALDDDERLGIVEVKHELVLPQDRHYVSWEVSEAAGDSLADLARQATQAGFSRLVIGELLGAEAYFLIKAMSQMPCLTTIHAGDAREGGMQLVRYASEAGYAPTLLAEQLAANAPFVLYIERDAEGVRLTEVAEVSGASGDGRLVMVPWFNWDRSAGSLRRQPHVSVSNALMKRCEMFNVTLRVAPKR